MKRPIKNKALYIVLFIVASLLFLLDSCVQLRMSKSEINHYFANKEKKGVIHSYNLGFRKVNYVQVGDEALPLVIFVHGSPGSLSAFIDFLSDTALLKRAQLISIDRPGFGDSNFGNAEPSLAKQSEYIKSILDHNKNKRPVILVGHSMGGPVICRTAMDYPDLIDGLVIVAGSIAPDLEPKEWYRAPLATPFLRWMIPRSFRASNQEIYHLKPELQEMLPLWPKIKSHTIVIQGGKDDLVSPGNADFAKKMLVNAKVEFTLVEDMNHFVPWSHPELIRQAVLKLLKDLNDRDQ